MNDDLINVARRNYEHSPCSDNELLSNGRRKIPRIRIKTIEQLLEHTDGRSRTFPNDDDCQECLNSGIAGPYPPEYGNSIANLGGKQLSDDQNWIMQCPYCSWQDEFPGLYVLGTDRWLIPPSSQR